MEQQIKILAVDDNEAVLKLLSIRLNRSDFSLFTVDNGYSAMRMVNSEKFDLVLTDICMPGIDGNLLTRYVRNVSMGTPVVAVTAAPEAARVCFDAIIEKPIDFASLIDTIEKLCGEMRCASYEF